MVLPTRTRDNILIGYPKEYSVQNVGAYVLKQLEGYGSSVMMVDSSSGKQLTAAELRRDVATVAEQLRSRGIAPGTTVGFCSENRLEFPVPVIASLSLGAICAPLNPLYTPGELKHTMGISKPTIVFCSPFTAAKLLEVKPDIPSLTTLIVFGDVTSDETFEAFNDLLVNKVNPNTFRPNSFNPANTVAVNLCSSGTTGLPKCVELTHANLMAFIENLSDNRLIDRKDDDVLLGLIPFFHGYGFGVMLVGLAAKLKLIVMSMFQEEHFLETIQNYKVTVLFLVPPLIVFLAKHPLVAKYDLSSVRRVGCGAAPLSKEVQLAAQKRLKFKADTITQGYGMTELSIACCFMPEGKNKIGSSGVVTFGMTCKVIDIETGKALPPYKEGELCFQGPFVMKGYRDNVKATEETIDKEGWLHTGDIGYFDVDGYLYIVDRLKELIKYKGFQVAPAELEAILLTNPKIKDAAVIGIPDEEAGELPFAYIVRQPDASISAKEIQKFVAEKVSAQKRLAGGVTFLDEIPKNPSGKILRRELRTLYKNSQKSKL